MSTGLLPSKIWNNATSKFYEVSAISSSVSHSSEQNRVELNPNKWTLSSLKIPNERKNIPLENICIASYLSQVELGFADTYKSLLWLKEKDRSFEFLNVFADLPVRFINRNTIEYENARLNQFHPLVCLKEEYRNNFFADFYKKPVFFVGKEVLVDHEVNALKNLDIPYFWADSSKRNLYFSKNSQVQVIEDFFEQSGEGRLRNRWDKKLNNFDLFRQLWFIRNSILLTGKEEVEFNWNPTDWKAMASLYRALSGKTDLSSKYQWIRVGVGESLALLPDHIVSENLARLVELDALVSVQIDLNSSVIDRWQQFFTEQESVPFYFESLDKLLDEHERRVTSRGILTISVIKKINRLIEVSDEDKGQIYNLLNRSFKWDFGHSKNIPGSEDIWDLFYFASLLQGKV